VLHIFLLIIAGLILTGILSAILENLAFQNHPYAAKILAGIGVIIAAWTHTWIRLTVIIAVAMLYVMVRRDLDRRRANSLEGDSAKLVGAKKPPQPYVDAGMHLLRNLIHSLRLEGWESLLPVYSAAEIEVIEAELASFQRMANEEMRGNAVFHPEIIEIQRPLVATALQNFAARDWRFTEQKELPADWKLRVSTYLKAWAGGLNPNSLIEMAEMLMKAGYKTEAKAALEVVLLFPSYADKFFGGSDSSRALANGIVNQAKEKINAL
jgi:hypothetical protein